jgi:hypothetical protein
MQLVLLKKIKKKSTWGKIKWGTISYRKKAKYVSLKAN